ncbi:MAG: hypothetical protein FJW37_11225, partial [Acidobacteria bacterium]|nr:hypothetical protein [Acidobacteriota bacterium]
MTTALYFAIAGAALLLALVTFVQLLYFESLRLRTRELASVKFFKETLEERLKMKAELGAVSFSLIKHVLLLLTGILMLAVLDPAGGTLPRIGQAVLISAILTLAAAYGTPQVLLRRTQGAWLLPLAPFLRWLALAARPAVA